MKTITDKEYAEMLQLLEYLADEAQRRLDAGIGLNMTLYPDEFQAVINLRDSYLAMKAREDERLANLKRSQQSKSPHKVATAKANLSKGREKVEQMRANDPEFRQKLADNLAKAREKRGSTLIKKATMVADSTSET